jgi:hypothetical protein
MAITRWRASDVRNTAGDRDTGQVADRTHCRQ